MGDAIQEKLLIVNADDLGLDPRINRGIAQACSEGIVRSVSLLAVGRGFDDALSRLKDLPGIGVGIHICLVEEKPVLPEAVVPTLLDRKGYLHSDWKQFLMRLVTGKVCLQEVAQEMEAQIRKILERGIRPTHLDSHQYLHFVPDVLDLMTGLAKKYDIKWVRYPQRSRGAWLFNWRNLLKRSCLAFSAASRVQKIKELGIGLPDYSYALGLGGRLNVERTKACLRQMENGMNDLVCHPGYFPEAIRYQRSDYHWETELNALRDPEVLALVKELKISLGHYGS